MNASPRVTPTPGTVDEAVDDGVTAEVDAASTAGRTSVVDEDATDVAVATVTWVGAIGTVVVTAGTTVPTVVVGDGEVDVVVVDDVDDVEVEVEVDDDVDDEEDVVDEADVLEDAGPHGPARSWNPVHGNQNNSGPCIGPMTGSIEDGVSPVTTSNWTGAHPRANTTVVTPGWIEKVFDSTLR